MVKNDVDSDDGLLWCFEGFGEVLKFKEFVFAEFKFGCWACHV